MKRKPIPQGEILIKSEPFRLVGQVAAFPVCNVCGKPEVFYRGRCRGCDRQIELQTLKQKNLL